MLYDKLLTTTTTHTCDKCGKSFDHELIENAKCPSEAPMMEVSVGYHQPPSNGVGNWYSRVGASLGEICKYCQEELIAYLRYNYPAFKLVSFND